MPAVKVEGEGDGIRIAARDVLALNSLGSADPALLVVAPSQSAQSPFVIDAEEPRYRQRFEPTARSGSKPSSQRSEAGECPLLVGPGKLAESDHIRRTKNPAKEAPTARRLRVSGSPPWQSPPHAILA